MYTNKNLSPDEEKKIRIEFMRIKKRSPDEIFSEQYRNNNSVVFNDYFEKHYTKIYEQQCDFPTAVHPLNYYVFYNKDNGDIRIGEMVITFHNKPDFISINEIHEYISSLNAQSDLNPKEIHRKKIMNEVKEKYEELISLNHKNLPKPN